MVVYSYHAAVVHPLQCPAIALCILANHQDVDIIYEPDA